MYVYTLSIVTKNGLQNSLQVDLGLGVDDYNKDDDNGRSRWQKPQNK